MIELCNKLTAPFDNEDIEWRVQKCDREGKWAMIVPYVTARAVHARLDEVFPLEWKVEFRVWLDESVLCRISVHNGKEWIYREDGAPLTSIESVKGGFSDSEKRAAVQFGIGRYLYSLDTRFANISRVGKPSEVRKDLNLLRKRGDVIGAFVTQTAKGSNIYICCIPPLINVDPDGKTIAVEQC